MRNFLDGAGRQWQVWRVTPYAPVYRERRREARRTAGAPWPEAEERRTTPDRRKGDIQQGWLCFDCATERRRFFPIPSGWESYSDERLLRLLGASTPVRKTPDL
jgi:hypothetical protein